MTQNIDDVVTILIDRTPQIVPLAMDGNEDRDAKYNRAARYR